MCPKQKIINFSINHPLVQVGIYYLYIELYYLRLRLFNIHNNKKQKSHHQKMHSITNQVNQACIKKIPKKSINSSSQSDQFQLEYHQIKKLGLQVNKKKLKVGNWSAQENAVYLTFLINNRSDFTSQAERRKKKVFYRLSKILRKRTPDQCRSHHQKLQMKFDDKIDRIIEWMKIKLERREQVRSQSNDKKAGISEEKTGLVKTTVETERTGQFEAEQSSFYRVSKEGQNVLSLQIFIDKIREWG